LSSTAVSTFEVTAAFFDPPLPLLYYELKLYFRLPNKGLTRVADSSAASGISGSLLFTLLKKSKPNGASSSLSSYLRGASTYVISGYYF
jgi:hypothetical protein